MKLNLPDLDGLPVHLTRFIPGHAWVSNTGETPLGIFTSCAGPIGKEARAARASHHVNVGLPHHARWRVLGSDKKSGN